MSDTIEANRTVTIEKTSKNLKGLLIVAWVLMPVTLFAALLFHAANAALSEPGDPPSVAVIAAWLGFAASLIFYIVTKFRIWWNHG